MNSTPGHMTSTGRYMYRTRGAAPWLVVAAMALALGAAGALLNLTGSRPPAAPIRLDDVTTHGEWVWIARADGDSLRAYVAYPERRDTAPAVIVIHEIYGLTDWEPTVADRLAAAGYVAVVPDLLSSKHGRTPADADSARALIGDLERERVMTDLDAAFAWLNEQPAVTKGRIGTIGFCWGGGNSFAYATHNPRLAAAVVAYGPAPDSTQLASIAAPVLGVYGENDARINADLDRVARQMQAAGKSFERDVYPETGHGFLKPGRRGSDGPQPARAWERILAFYAKHL